MKDREKIVQELRTLREKFHAEWRGYQVRGQQPTAEEKIRIEELDRQIKALDEVSKVFSEGQSGVILNQRPLKDWVKDLQNEDKYDIRLGAAQTLTELGPSLKEVVDVLRDRAKKDTDQYVKHFAGEAVDIISKSVVST